MMNGIETTKEIEEKLEKFYKLHLESPINLTTIKERDEFYLKHYYDSIYYFQKYLEPSGSLADIGSGGGFPGMVLAIFYPELEVTLIESIGKKCRFLETSAEILGLKNVKVINDRAENIKGKVYDIITARGVSKIDELLKNTIHLSKKNTKWILYKGERLEEEIEKANHIISKRSLKVEKVRIEEPVTRSYCIISY